MGLNYGKVTLFFSDGREYVGEFKDGEQHGQGTHTLTGGGESSWRVERRRVLERN